MRITLPSGIPHPEAPQRARGRKQVGRKHNHQPRGRALEKRLSAPAKHQKIINAKRKKFSAKVRAYWRGDLLGYPTP